QVGSAGALCRLRARPRQGLGDAARRHRPALATGDAGVRPATMTSRDPDGDRLYTDPELVAFYDLENAWGADSDTCRVLAKEARSVLDLGCGTGIAAAALVEGRSVTGVDPAAAMLAVARDRPGGDRVD